MNPVEKIQTVLKRHLEVTNDGFCLIGFQEFDGVLNGRKRSDIVAINFKLERQDKTDVCFVVDDEDFHGATFSIPIKPSSLIQVFFTKGSPSVNPQEMIFQDLLILTAPPASGKTSWITNFMKELETQPLVISPLRALANECLDRWGPSAKVKTPEEWITCKMFADVVIIDEFHLWFYWGDTFRPLLWEAFYEVVQKAKLVVLLTATLSSQMLDEVKVMESQFCRLTWIDFGNQALKFPPQDYVVASSRRWLEKQLVLKRKDEKSTLVFCEFRNQVRDLEARLLSSGFSCVSCVGGEARFMKEKFLQHPAPDFIIATTVLSHGVNLPKISRIFFLYGVKNPDFWLQMIARGGRQGEAYDVFALEKPFGLSFSRLKNAWRIFQLSLREKFSFDALLRTLSRIKLRHDF